MFWRNLLHLSLGFCHPEDGVSMFFQNMSTVYVTALCHIEDDGHCVLLKQQLQYEWLTFLCVEFSLL